MANSYSEARKNIKYIASLMKGLVELDAELEKVGTIQNAAALAQSNLDALEARKVAAGDDLVKARTRSAELLTKASDDAARIIGAANSESLNARVAIEDAGKVLANAQSVAASIISEAKAEADKIVAGQSGKLAAANNELVALAMKRDEVTAQIKVLEVKHANATQALAAMAAKIAA